MNILFISHGLYPCKVGGAEIFNYYLINELSKYYKIFVVTICKEKIDLDVDFIRINPRRFGIGRVSVPMEDLLNIMKLRDQIDLVHVSYMRSPWSQWLPYPILKKRLNIPYIVTIHGGGMHEWKPEFPHKFFFNNASEIVGISSSIKEEYEKRTGRNIKLIPPLIPFEKFTGGGDQIRGTLGFDDKDIILIAVGSIKNIKGSDVLLNAFISFGRKFIEEHKLRLVFVGDGEMRGELEQISQREDLDGHVCFLGNIPRKKMSSIYSMADIYLIPSLFEGTPIAMLEAMFNGMPIIGSDTNGINNIIEHKKNGLLFEVSNYIDLKNQIEYALENTDMLKKMADNAKKTFDSEYSFETVVRQYTEIYNNVRRMN